MHRIVKNVLVKVHRMAKTAWVKIHLRITIDVHIVGLLVWHIGMHSLLVDKPRLKRRIHVQ